MGYRRPNCFRRTGWIRHAQVVQAGHCNMSLAQLVSREFFPEVGGLPSLEDIENGTYSSSSGDGDCSPSPCEDAIQDWADCIHDWDYQGCGPNNQDLVYVYDPEWRELCVGDRIIISQDEQGNWWLMSIFQEPLINAIDLITDIICDPETGNIGPCYTRVYLPPGTVVCDEFCTYDGSSSSSST